MAAPSEFGTNVWLVDEMYRRFREDPASVSDAWRRFFEEGYRPYGAPSEAAPPPSAETVPGEGELVPLRGVLGVVAGRMDESLSVPTATSVRSIPAKLLEVNRLILNNQLRRLTVGGKVSFTHLIAWAVVKALVDMPDLNVSFRRVEGEPFLVRHPHVNLGIAVDVVRGDGTRALLVPNLKAADTLDFRAFWLGYEDLIRRAHTNRLTADDFAGTTVTVTNPGMIGTVQSVPRLMAGQGLIVGVGAIAYPPEFQGADEGFLARQGIGRVVTITSTYDHRVIQGARSGEFLSRIHRYLLGEDGFYDEIFEAMEMPYTPARWAVDDNPPLGSPEWAEKQANVFRLINAHRVRGHLIADLDPLRMHPPRMYPELDPLYYGLTIWDLDREFASGGVGGREVAPLGTILSTLRDAYCRTVGIEYMHIQDTDQKAWIQSMVEGRRTELTHAEKLRILDRLNRAEAFERFLHTKYVGHKRFGLEGAESLIPLLDAVLGAAVAAGAEKAIIGMAHRGRLNVLANIIGKPLDRIFREFEGDLDPQTTGGTGDVKYHLGADGVYETADGGELAVAVVANPSHLEAVDPVLEGVVRAEQDQLDADGTRRIVPILIHGDAAFAGQGVVAETLNLSQLAGYRTGGTVHIVVNNQVGFTTAAQHARSSFYATDVAKMIQAPIIHVNGDDPEAVVRVARLAFAYRTEFGRDVVVDLVCYRRRGHNEADEPSYTQPLMYQRIESHRSVRKLYLERLVNNGELTVDEGEKLLEDFRRLLEAAFAATKDTAAEPPSVPSVRPEPAVSSPVTAVPRERLEDLLSRLTTPPEGFTLHPKLVRVMEARRTALADDAVDWATAEALAFATLATDGTPVRLAGEDSRRGTFSQRHADLVDFRTGETWSPLEELDGAPVRIVDSLLSEFAAVGFEYGYSVGWPEALVLWEAQFGDFANGAQVIIDQFVVAGEAKWGQRSGLVLLLPHGYEGQGPEHSSARIERFLQLCAEDNLVVAVPSTAGQYFHLLRRQALARPRRPLVVFTPKSLLRHRPSFASVDALTAAAFRPVIGDPDQPADARRLVLCTGKVFYDLARRRDTDPVDGVALVRVEELYPFPAEALVDLSRRHPRAEVVWCQEEPENMGAFRAVRDQLEEIFGRPVAYRGRPPAASPATGSYRRHLAEQRALVEAALGG